MEDVNKDKYDFLLSLLEEGDAMVCLDARRPEVDIPEAHKNNPSLNLIFNLNFRRPLNILPEGIFATLSFSGRPHKCIIPFDAVWALYEPSMKKGQVWEESLPKDIDLAVDKQLVAKPGKAQTAKPSAPASRPKTKTSSPDAKKKDRSHLRVIK